MDDLMGKLQNILNSKEGQEQLKNIANMLSNSNNNNQSNQQQNNNNQSQQNSSNGFDISAIANMLGSMNQNNSNQQSQNNSNPQDTSQNNFDMSPIANMLSGLNQNNNSQEQNNSMPNIDINMILKLQKLFQSMNVNDKNSQLLLALKPHFGEKRSAKVDQAISLMRLFSMLPMLKDSGLFEGL